MERGKGKVESLPSSTPHSLLSRRPWSVVYRLWSLVPFASSPRSCLLAGLLTTVVLLTLLGLVGLGLRVWTDRTYGPREFSRPELVPPTNVAIVFGAWEIRGQPSSILADRVAAAVRLYHSGVVSKLLMTGGNPVVGYNEPGAMARYAHKLGVPTEDIVQDYAGRRTYDSCYRAVHIFGLRKAVLVTQRYHLDRAMFTCSALGMAVVGFAADTRPYPGDAFRWWREVPATMVAWLDLYVRHPVPILGAPIPIVSVLRSFASNR